MTHPPGDSSENSISSECRATHHINSPWLDPSVGLKPVQRCKPVPSAIGSEAHAKAQEAIDPAERARSSFARPRPKRDGSLRLVAEAALKGTFYGWNGDSIFVLNNGEVWQQAAYRVREWLMQHPAVRLWSRGTDFWLEVEATNEILQVRRVG